MDDIFRALNDATRRDILDALNKRHGMTTSEIEKLFPSMTRFAVIKHLKVLEASSLITTHKEGRYKFHYLNPIPLQEMADRWIDRFRAPIARSLVDMKDKLEKENEMEIPVIDNPKLVYVTIIKTTPEKLWQALTDGEVTKAYYYHGRLQSEMKPGSEFNYMTPENELMCGGELIEATPFSKLVHTMKGYWSEDMKDDAPSRITYEIDQVGECCKLTVTHDQFGSQTATYHNVNGGWPGILAGLKTYLETGEILGFIPE